jgi:hypothetical protein
VKLPVSTSDRLPSGGSSRRPASLRRRQHRNSYVSSVSSREYSSDDGAAALEKAQRGGDSAIRSSPPVSPLSGLSKNFSVLGLFRPIGSFPDRIPEFL